MKSLEVALAFSPTRLPAARIAVQQLHKGTKSHPREANPLEVSALRARITKAADSADPRRALITLAHSLVARDLLAAVRSIGQWAELRGPVATIARERPLPTYVAALWNVWQAHPRSDIIVKLLAEMGLRFGIERAVGDRYRKDAIEWFKQHKPVDSIVLWTDRLRISWKDLGSISESPFAPDAPLVDQVLHRTLQIGSASQLNGMTNDEILAGWQAMSGLDHMTACANFLRRIGPSSWTGRFLALDEVRANYGLPGAERSHRTFWLRLTGERCRDFREFFIARELDHAFKGDSDRHRFWTEQRREILDVCHGTAGTADWSLIDFSGFSVVEFFELGNAAYLYPADEPMLKHIRSCKRASSPSELKTINYHSFLRRAELRDNRIIHSQGWQPRAWRILDIWKARYS